MSIRLRIVLMTASIACALGAAVSYAKAAPSLDDGTNDKATPGLVKLADCNDGKAYYVTPERAGRPDKGHIGACRGHKGVAKWADGSTVKAKGAKGGEYR